MQGPLARIFALIWWIRVLQDRTFGPISGGRLRDLLMTPTRLAALFPALLVAPILVAVFFDIAWMCASELDTIGRTIFALKGGFESNVGDWVIHFLTRALVLLESA